MKELYKLILVDDEDEIRGRIVSMITADTGFQVVASASNGYDALELIEEHKPHALITDIRMPYIDGITLAQEIRSDFSNIKVIFLTGYSEFDYARKAVELDVISLEENGSLLVKDLVLPEGVKVLQDPEDTIVSAYMHREIIEEDEELGEVEASEPEVLKQGKE